MNDFKLSAFIRYQKSFSNILKMKTKSPPHTGFEPTPCWGQKHARKLLKRAYLGRALGDEIVSCFERLDKGLIFIYKKNLNRFEEMKYPWLVPRERSKGY